MRFETQEHEFASKGVAGTGLGLGIAGTALGLLNNNGGLSGILGGTARCNEDHYVTRYEAAQYAEISSLKSQIALRDSNTYVDQKLLEVYRYFDKKLDGVNAAINAQAVYNATNTATIGCLNNQVAQLMALTKMVIPIASICPTPAVATTTA